MIFCLVSRLSRNRNFPIVFISNHNPYSSVVSTIPQLESLRSAGRARPAHSQRVWQTSACTMDRCGRSRFADLLTAICRFLRGAITRPTPPKEPPNVRRKVRKQSTLASSPSHDTVITTCLTAPSLGCALSHPSLSAKAPVKSDTSKRIPDLQRQDSL